MSSTTAAFTQTMQDPPGQLANYQTRPPGQSITIFTGIYLLQQESWSVRVRGRLDLYWLPTPTIRFHGRAGGRETHRLKFGHARIEIPSLRLTSAVLIFGRTGLIPAAAQYRGITD